MDKLIYMDEPPDHRSQEEKQEMGPKEGNSRPSTDLQMDVRSPGPQAPQATSTSSTGVCLQAETKIMLYAPKKGAFCLVHFYK